MYLFLQLFTQSNSVGLSTHCDKNTCLLSIVDRIFSNKLLVSDKEWNIIL